MRERSITLLITGIILIFLCMSTVWSMITLPLSVWLYFVGNSVTTLAAAVACLFVGIVGIIHWKNQKKANACFVFGIISLAISIISMIFELYLAHSISHFHTHVIPYIITYGIYIGTHIAYIMAAHKFAKPTRDTSYRTK